MLPSGYTQRCQLWVDGVEKGIVEPRLCSDIFSDPFGGAFNRRCQREARPTHGSEFVRRRMHHSDEAGRIAANIAKLPE
ncbi:MAG: hypothetical protein WB689_21355, partial [Xanthobacteraceae bacterium]